MKLMVASDIHGSALYCEKMLLAYEREKAERLLLLGDLLYHGPRNDLPPGYDPKAVTRALNAVKDEIFCVRGNCDSEVDQMVLEFPIMAESLLLFLEEYLVFATHGHIYNGANLPPLKKGDILLHGHTHVQAVDASGDYLYLNPGSISLPKQGNKNSYMLYENKRFCIKDLDGDEIASYFLG